MSEIRVIALDLDGTLTTSDKKITKHTKEIIHRAIKEKDAKIVLASGRPTPGVREVVKQLKLDELGGYMLAYNGGMILDAKDEKVLDVTYLDRSVYATICGVTEHFKDVAPLTYEGDIIISSAPENPYLKEEMRCTRMKAEVCDDLLARVGDREVVKFLVIGEPSLLPPVKDYLEPLIGDKADLFFSCPFFLECVPKGVNKGQKMQTLLELTGYKKENLMGCGDALNDIPLLEASGVAVAMENAYDEVKAVADFVTLSNDRDGAAFAIEKYVLD
ncbi:MAG: HAD family phosphatase [Pseudobutyrivibrio sp.]|nr:HAD family phosphatase [Pseudobutyrivibrio sp.]